MIYLTSFNKKQSESLDMKKVSEDLAAILTEEKWEMNFFENLNEFLNYVNRKPLIDIGCFDVTYQDSISALLELRNNYKEMLLLIVADVVTPPTEYLRIGVRADALLLRPFSEAILRETMREVINSYTKNEDDSEVFVMSEREGKLRIPYDLIYYFEAKEKKIFVRTANDEYGFYSTLEQLEMELPDEFIKCHRSFIINTAKLEEVLISKNMVRLLNGFEIPLSRSYKPLLKKYR